MTIDEAIAIIENEKECVNRANKNDYCNRDCYNCELVKTDREILTALDMAMQALEQEPSGDLISREAVLDTISELNAISFYEAQEDSKECYYELRQAIKDLPSVKPQEPKTGHWIPVSERLPKHYDSHDLIHRETARRIIDSPRTKEQMLMVLDSAENQKKTGHWVYEPRKRLINETDEGCEYITEYWCKCSECGGDFGFQKMSDAYCKYCGARMESEKNG